MLRSLKVEQVQETYITARSSSDALAISSQDEAKADMVDAGVPRGILGEDEACFLGRAKDEVEVAGLAKICDIDQPVGFLCLQPMSDGGQVCRAVQESSICLLNDEWVLMTLHPDNLHTPHHKILEYALC